MTKFVTRAVETLGPTSTRTQVRRVRSGTNAASTSGLPPVRVLTPFPPLPPNPPLTPPLPPPTPAPKLPPGPPRNSPQVAIVQFSNDCRLELGPEQMDLERVTAMLENMVSTRGHGVLGWLLWPGRVDKQHVGLSRASPFQGMWSRGTAPTAAAPATQGGRLLSTDSIGFDPKLLDPVTVAAVPHEWGDEHQPGHSKGRPAPEAVESYHAARAGPADGRSDRLAPGRFFAWLGEKGGHGIIGCVVLWMCKQDRSPAPALGTLASTRGARPGPMDCAGLGHGMLRPGVCDTHTHTPSCPVPYFLAPVTPPDPFPPKSRPGKRTTWRGDWPTSRATSRCLRLVWGEAWTGRSCCASSQRGARPRPSLGISACARWTSRRGEARRLSHRRHGPQPPLARTVFLLSGCLASARGRQPGTQTPVPRAPRRPGQPAAAKGAGGDREGGRTRPDMSLAKIPALCPCPRLPLSLETAPAREGRARWLAGPGAACCNSFPHPPPSSSPPPRTQLLTRWRLFLVPPCDCTLYAPCAIAATFSPPRLPWRRFSWADLGQALASAGEHCRTSALGCLPTPLLAPVQWLCIEPVAIPDVPCMSFVFPRLFP